MADYHTRAAVREMQKIAEAQAEVSPVVGALPAMDSAAKVYAEALKRMGHDVRDLERLGNDAALRVAFQTIRRGGRRPAVAMDAASHTSYLERFPNGDRLR